MERPGGLALITPRETEVLQLMADGNAIARIAQLLGISAQTVKNHRNSVYHKLGVTGYANAGTRAVVLAWRAGLIR